MSQSFQYIESFLNQIGIFYTHLVKPGDPNIGVNIQRGVIRTNCIDSLDRTNLMQQLIGIAALERQLKALKILEEDENLQSNNEI